MKVVHWMTIVAGIAFVLPAQAPAAIGDPELVMYRFPGVRDTGESADVGVATAFHCTNYSGVQESIRIVVRAFDASLLGNVAVPIDHLATITALTHPAVIYIEDTVLLPVGVIVDQGTAAIAATSPSIVCTAMTVDAASASPIGIPLHGIRFNPVPGSQE